MKNKSNKSFSGISGGGGLKSFTRRFGDDPVFDWGLIIAASLVIVVLAAVLGFSVYNGVPDTSLLYRNAPVNSAKPLLDANLLSKTSAIIDTRNADRTKFSDSYSGPADPSR